MTASHDVLNTAELLELILANLDIRKLLSVQSVSTYWRDLIANSITLQRKLFMKPATSKDLISLDIAPARGVVRLPMQAPDMLHSSIDEPTSQDFAVLHPLLTWHGSPDYLGNTWAPRPGASSVGQQRTSVTPSWRKMLAMQPPLFKVSVIGGSDEATYPAGTTLGQMFDAFDESQRGWIRGDIEPHGSCASSSKFWEVVDMENPKDEASKESNGKDEKAMEGNREVRDTAEL